MNKLLENLYQTNITNLAELEIDLDRYDGPHLLSVFDPYFSATTKILFIGQETNGWFGYVNSNVKAAMQKYTDFGLAQNGKKTAIWQYMYCFRDLLMPSSQEEKNFLWTNLSKFCIAETGGPISYKEFGMLTEKFNVLSSEIKIVKPDVIIFFTGHRSDDLISDQFEDDTLFSKVDPSVNIEDLARVSNSLLPFHSYRISHPQTLQRQKKKHLLDLIANNIKE